MKETALISVIVPVYNTEPYLRKCLDSILGQTYRDLEIILVDDGSTDGSGAICDQYAREDSRIRVIHQANSGVSAARNAGLAAAHGSWIGWVDSDDYLDADMYLYLLSLCESNSADFAQCGIYFETETERELQFCVCPPLVCFGGINAVDALLWKNIANSSCCKLFSAQLLESLAFSGNYTMGEDLLFNVQALANSSSFVLGDQPKYHYVQRSDGACHSLPTRSRLISYRDVIRKMQKDYADFPGTAQFFWSENQRNNLDLCSKCICYALDDCADLLRDARREVTEGLHRALRDPVLSRKEKLKLFLISRCWPLYRMGLPIYKKLSSRQLPL